MRVLTLVVFSVIIIVVIAAKTRKTEQSWATFKQKYGKNYESKENEVRHKSIFAENLRQVKLHNKAYERGLVTYKIGINQFSDRRAEDVVRERSGLRVGDIPENNRKAITVGSTETLPDSYNACVPPNMPLEWGVRDQRSCGSCWAFSTISTIEASRYLQTNQLYDLSEQHLNDCTYPTRTGCNGGWMPDAFKYLAKSGGTINETDYPYTGANTTCPSNSFTKVVQLNANVSYFNVKPYDDASLMTAIFRYGPLSGAVNATNAWNSYKEGVFSTNLPCPGPNHAITVCGWNNTSKGLYWIIKNSWSASWGQQGYIWVNGTRLSPTSTVTYGGFFANYCFYANLVP